MESQAYERGGPGAARRHTPAHAFAGRAHTGMVQCPTPGPRSHWGGVGSHLQEASGRSGVTRPVACGPGLPLRLAALSRVSLGEGAVSGVGVGVSSAPGLAAARSLIARRPGPGRGRKGRRRPGPPVRGLSSRPGAQVWRSHRRTRRPPYPTPNTAPAQCHFPCPTLLPLCASVYLLARPLGQGLRREGCSRRVDPGCSVPASVARPAGMGPWAWV